MFKQGNPGKPKGANNHTTRQVKQVIADIVTNELYNINTLLEQVTAYERLQIIVKLLPYVIQKDMQVDHVTVTLIDDEIPGQSAN